MSLDDFNNALVCFKPASLHGIKLHQGSDLTWQDVGGLDDIKQTLKETLEWPAKVKLHVARSFLIKRQDKCMH